MTDTGKVSLVEMFFLAAIFSIEFIWSQLEFFCCEFLPFNFICPFISAFKSIITNMAFLEHEKNVPQIVSEILNLTINLTIFNLI